MVAVVYDEICLSHMQDAGHPERQERITAILGKIGGLDWVEIIPPEKFPDGVLLHDEEYRGYVKAFRGYMTGDTIVRNNTYECALNSIDCALTAASHNGFSLSRPPGHHAGRNFGGGFCYFNNVAIAANELAKRRKRVFILDWDLHHGNGTENIVRGMEGVFYVSLHQGWIYPGTGHLEESGDNVIDLPMPSGAGNEDYLSAFDEIVLPALDAFGPDSVLVSHGSDAHSRDPLGSLELTSEIYGVFTEKILAHASNLAVILEGGYDLKALSESTHFILAAMEGMSVGRTSTSKERKADIAEARRTLSRRFEFLR